MTGPLRTRRHGFSGPGGKWLSNSAYRLAFIESAAIPYARTCRSELFHNVMERSTQLRAGDALRAGTPRARLSALADADDVEWLDAPRPSPHLARFRITPQDDDGVATARLRVRGRTWLAAAQDERFLRGSVGAEHGDALRALFERACGERPDG